MPAHLTLLGPTEVDTARAAGDRGAPGRRSPRRTSRSRCTCAAPARSGRSPRWCSWRWRPASASASCSPRRSARPPELRRDARFPYHPHVTVAQDVPAEALDAVFEDLAGFAARFEVDGFTLFSHSGEGPLAAAPRLPAGRLRSSGVTVSRVNPIDRACGADRPRDRGRRRRSRASTTSGGPVSATTRCSAAGSPRRSPTTASSRSSRWRCWRTRSSASCCQTTTSVFAGGRRLPQAEPAVAGAARAIQGSRPARSASSA